MKAFLDWIGLKSSLDNLESRPPFVSEGDLWWASIGTNVGSEIDGKSKLFTRPVIIYKKLGRGFFFVIPTTTKHKEGSWYVPFTHRDKFEIACLHQARSIDYRRLYGRLGLIDETDFARIREGFKNLYLD